jgi:hypothetical protein
MSKGRDVPVVSIKRIEANGVSVPGGAWAASAPECAIGRFFAHHVSNR